MKTASLVGLFVAAAAAFILTGCGDDETSCASACRAGAEKLVSCGQFDDADALSEECTVICERNPDRVDASALKECFSSATCDESSLRECDYPK